MPPLPGSYAAPVSAPTGAVFFSSEGGEDPIRDMLDAGHEGAVFIEDCVSPGVITEAECSMTFVCSTNTAYRQPIARLLAERLQAQLGLARTTATALQTALHEAVINAVIHGNLEITHPITSLEAFDTYYEWVHEKLVQESYARRWVEIHISWDEHTVLVTVDQEGDGGAILTWKNTAPAQMQVNGQGMNIINSCCLAVEVAREGRALQMLFSRKPMLQVGAAASADFWDEEPQTAETLQERPDIYNSYILVVDDDATSRLLIGEILKRDGFTQVATAKNGKEALIEIARQLPDIIILDLMMPVMDGFAFCRKALQIPSLRHTPILVQTALNNPQQRVEAFGLGATDIVTKPVNRDELLARIRVHLEHKHLLGQLVDYHERLERELYVARDMQKMLTPSESALGVLSQQYGLHLQAVFETSSGIGGDLWGVQALSASELAFYLCDMSGHGVTSALNTFRLHTLIRQPELPARDPAAMLSALNVHLKQLIPTGQFATFFYAILDIENHELRYATAAAPPPLMWNAAAQRATALEGRGIPLGAVAGAAYDNYRISFAPGDALLLYSDALVETLCKDGNMIDEASVGSFMEGQLHHKEPQRFMTRLLGWFESRTAAPPEDDLTLVFCQRL